MENIEHQESAVMMYWTTEYGKFHFLKGNRDINERKVKKIMESVTSGIDLFKYNPIMVNEDMYIIDGQHRYIACMKLKINVYYVIVPEFSLRQIAEINNNTTRWKAKDFLCCYMDCGNKDYDTLDLFIKDYQIHISTAINLLYYGRAHIGGSRANEVFKDGDFEVREMDAAMRLMEKSGEFQDLTDYYRDRGFLKALESLLGSDRYDHEKVLAKLRKHGLRIQKKSNYKDYILHIEELYNFHNSKRQIIFEG